MPGDHGFRCDDNEGGLPTRPRTRQPRLEPAVRAHEPQSSRPRPLQHVQLMAQGGQHLEVKRGARPRQSLRRPQKRDQHRHHRERSLSRFAGNFNGGNTYALFGIHTRPDFRTGDGIGSADWCTNISVPRERGSIYAPYRN